MKHQVSANDGGACDEREGDGFWTISVEDSGGYDRAVSSAQGTVGEVA